jgi:peptide/nickel transport system permease protein
MQYYVSRALQMAATVFGALVIVFMVGRMLPGNPVILALGPEARPEQIAEMTHRLGYDRPIYIQFIDYVENLVFKGQMGTSFITYHDALSDVARFLPASMELVTYSILLAWTLALMLGIYAATHRNTFIDHLIRIYSIGGISIPQFFTGILLQLILGYWLNLLPIVGRIEFGVAPPAHITGWYLIDSILTGNSQALVSSFRCLILPVITLSSAPLNISLRLIRGSMLDEEMKDYVVHEKASGIPSILINYKYKLRNAVTPALTSIANTYGWTLGNAYVVETVFTWPGIGWYGVRAAIYKDLNVVICVSFLMSVIYVVIYFALDIAYAWLDPRIQRGYKTD